MSDLAEYFLQAELALAAYSELPGGVTGNGYRTALEDGGEGMAQTQARIFAEGWNVVEQYNGETTYSYIDEFGNPQQTTILTGLSATIFENVETEERYVAIRGTAGLADLLTDLVDISVIGTPERQAQYSALKGKIAEWLDNGTLEPGFTVAGHSLGGFLAGALLVDYPEEVGHAYLFNAPGVGGLRASLQGLLGLGSEPTLDLSKLTNVCAEGGGSMISGLGFAWGTPVPITIEVASSPLDNHSIVSLTDSLAIYDAFSRLAPALSGDDIGQLLRTASPRTSLTLDSGLGVLRFSLLGPGSMSGSTSPAAYTREMLYRDLGELLESDAYLALEGSAALRKLAGVDAATLAASAKSDFGSFLAVHHLLPFALEGAGSALIEAHSGLYAQWSADRLKRIDGAGELLFSDAYIEDRAQMLAFLMVGNANDTTAFASNQVGDQVLYRDLGALPSSGSALSGPTELNVFLVGGIANPAGPNTRVIAFGTEAADLLRGRGNNDRLYGGAGADALIGLEGADRLEGGGGADRISGGSGNDTLLGSDRVSGDTLDGGSGFDTFFADWGDTVVDEAGSARGGIIYVGAEHMELADGYRVQGESFFTASNGLKYWELSDGAISVFGPDGAAALLIAAPTAQVAGLGNAGSTIVSGRPDLGIRLVTQRTDSIGEQGGGSGGWGAVLGLWDLARNWRPFADPLALDLDGDGFETLGIPSDGAVLFDHSGLGVRNGTGWLTGGDAWLVLDRDGDGQISSGAELFGIDTRMPDGSTGANGFAALAPLDTNADGAVDGADAPLAAWQIPLDVDGDGLILPGEAGGASYGDLKVWQDANLNGISEPFELRSLAEAGISRIYLDSVVDERALPGGNRLLLGGTFERLDGTTGMAGALDLLRETFFREYMVAPAAGRSASSLPNVLGTGRVRDLQEAAAESPAVAGALQAAVNAGDRNAQKAAVSQLLIEWAGSSGMQGGSAAAAARASILYYVFGDVSLEYPWATAVGGDESGWDGSADWFGSFQSPDYQKRLLEMEVLEKFTGQTFADVLRLAPGSVPVEGGGVLHTLAIGVSSGNWSYVSQAYAALEESVYLSIAMQTRLEPYVDAILRGEGTSGFQEVEALLATRYAADPAAAIGDLVDLSRAAGVELVERGWIALPVILEGWLRSARDDAELAPLLGAMGIGFRSWHELQGTGARDVLLGGDWMPDSGGTLRLTTGNFGNDLIFGGDPSEATLSGGPGRDLLMGGAETDRVSGGTGRDFFLFGTGSGLDFLQPDSASGSTLPTDRDVLQFLPGILPGDVTVRRAANPFAQFDAVEFGIRGTGDIFTDLWFAHQDSTENERRLLDEVRFEDGTTWNAEAIRELLLQGDDSSQVLSTTQPGLRGFEDRSDRIDALGGNDGLVGLGGDDTLLGGNGMDTLEGGRGADLLDGGSGDDLLYGGLGVDTYLFSRGGGVDRMFKGNFLTWAASDDHAELDVIRVGDGISPDEVLLQRQAGQLRIFLVDGSATLLDTGNPLNPDYQGAGGTAPSIDRIEFADGTVWDAVDIRQRSLLGATAVADGILGYNGSGDLVHGLAGSDTLQGLSGDDTLDGGKGNDALEGGSGADTYLWRRGDGQDAFIESSSDTAGSTLWLEDVLPGEATWNAESGQLALGTEVLSIVNAPDTWQVRFADGTDVPLTALPGPSPDVDPPGDSDPDPGSGPWPPTGSLPTDGNDFLLGTPGPDTLAGGRGMDVLNGGAGTDVYRFNIGDGLDVIVEMPEFAGEANYIEFGPGIAPEDLVPLHVEGDELYVLMVGSGGVAFSAGISALRFDGGQVVPIGSYFPALGVAGTDPDTPSGGGGEETEGPPDEESPPDEPAGEGEEPGPVRGVSSSVEPDASAGVEPASGAFARAASPDPSSIGEPGMPVPNAVSRPSDRVGEPLDPLYREMTARFDVLLQVGRANLTERYAEAIREFEDRRRAREAPAEPPPPTEEQVMEWNRAMHAWHDRHPGFADEHGVEQDGAWTGAWSGAGGADRTFDELLNAGGTPGLANPYALPGLGGAARSPALLEGIRDLR